MGRIFFTGDMHGNLEARKLGSRAWPMGKELCDDDVVVALGDFELPWAEDATDEYWLDWLADKPWTTAFIDGNHENFNLLGGFPVEQWHGGNVHALRHSEGGRPKVVHLMRGQVFDVNGRGLFTLGGATSIDRHWRREGISWWPQELPSQEELDAARQALDRIGWRVDSVLTHCAASNVQYRLDRAYGTDRLTDFLFDVEKRLDYSCWLFGHYHVDRVVVDRQLAVYSCIWELLLDVADEMRGNSATSGTSGLPSMPLPKFSRRDLQDFLAAYGLARGACPRRLVWISYADLLRQVDLGQWLDTLKYLALLLSRYDRETLDCFCLDLVGNCAESNALRWNSLGVLDLAASILEVACADLGDEAVKALADLFGGTVICSDHLAFYKAIATEPAYARLRKYFENSHSSMLALALVSVFEALGKQPCETAGERARLVAAELEQVFQKDPLRALAALCITQWIDKESIDSLPELDFAHALLNGSSQAEMLGLCEKGLGFVFEEESDIDAAMAIVYLDEAADSEAILLRIGELLQERGYLASLSRACEIVQGLANTDGWCSDEIEGNADYHNLVASVVGFFGLFAGPLRREPIPLSIDASTAHWYIEEELHKIEEGLQEFGDQVCVLRENKANALAIMLLAAYFFQIDGGNEIQRACSLAEENPAFSLYIVNCWQAKKEPGLTLAKLIMDSQGRADIEQMVHNAAIATEVSEDALERIKSMSFTNMSCQSGTSEAMQYLLVIKEK